MDFLLKKTIEELKLRNYSFRTIKSYIRCIKDYFLFKQAGFDIFDRDSVKRFLLIKHERGYSSQTINLYLNAISFFYREVIKLQCSIGLKFAKRPKKLPVVLSHIEILKMINGIRNLKHRTMIALAYGSGLRVSEIISLKVQDVDLDNFTIHIKQAKGMKDRITIFPEKLIKDINIFLRSKNNNYYVFESERGGRLTARTAQQVFENALRRAGIMKPATFHSLRHSFATHLIENGVNLRYVQELLGHQNIRTTERYTHVTNTGIKKIKSPL